jgi:hypothetical protein
MRRFVRLVSVGVIMCFSVAAWAKDIYVSEAGSSENDGSKEKPLKLLWKAMKAAGEGDTIHVAEGNYTGQGGAGCLPRIDKSRLKLVGGWSKDFSKRDPFTYLTTIIQAADSKNGCNDSTFKTETGDKLDGVVIDGFVIDRAPLNVYRSDGSLDASKSPSAPAIELIGRGGFEVKNNVIVNGSWWGIYVKCGKDTKIENNVVFISVGRGIEAIPGSGWGKPTFTIKNNTSVFSYKMHTTEGRGISITNGTPYDIANNLLAFNDESGLGAKFPKDLQVNLIDNLFYFNKVGDAVLGGQGGLAVMANSFADDLEMKTVKGNKQQKLTSLPIDKGWFDKYLAREDAVEGKVTYDDLNNLRSSLGLPLIAKDGKRATNYAVRYTEWKDALKFVGLVPGAGAQKL